MLSYRPTSGRPKLRGGIRLYVHLSGSIVAGVRLANDPDESLDGGSAGRKTGLHDDGVSFGDCRRGEALSMTFELNPASTQLTDLLRLSYWPNDLLAGLAFVYVNRLTTMTGAGLCFIRRDNSTLGAMVRAQPAISRFTKLNKPDEGTLCSVLLIILPSTIAHPTSIAFLSSQHISAIPPLDRRGQHSMR